MGFVITESEILMVAHVFGLGGDLWGDTGCFDTYDKLVMRMDYPMAFITHSMHNFHCRGVNRELSLGESCIVAHDASQKPQPLLDWESRPFKPREIKGKVLPRHKQDRDEDTSRIYCVYDATYAATALNGIPERIFLFVNNERFNMQTVIESLRLYRISNRLPEVGELLQKFCSECK
jgi:hypothetical protein